MNFISSPPLLCLQHLPHLPGSLLVKLTNALLRLRFKFTRYHRHIPTRPHPAIGSTSLAFMTKQRSQANENTAMRGLRATALAQLQPTRTDRTNTRPSSATWCNHTAAAAVAVMLCFISMAAAQPGQCPFPAAWTTAALSVATDGHAATSLPNQGLAIFAGGWIGIYVILFFELLILQDWCDVGVGGLVLRGRKRALRCWR